MSASTLNVTTPGETWGMSEQGDINKTMLGQFFTKLAVRKVDYLVETGQEVELVDEQVATLTGPKGVCEVDIFGCVRWIR